jgi:hypothetical protein
MNKFKTALLIIISFISGIALTAYLPVKESDNVPGNISQKQKEAFQKVFSPEIPEDLYFAGEKVPLENYDILESFDRELIINCFFHSQTIRFLKLAPRYFSIIEPILKKQGIPDDFKYLALAESGLNPRAVSPAGAVGIWQFMPKTAGDYGLEVTNEIDERYHIEKSTFAACKYLHESFEKYGNWTTVAASYNVGRNGIDRQADIQKEDHYYNLLLNDETSRYVFRILAIKTIMENPEDYGFILKKKDLYPVIPFKLVEIDGAVENFADFAKEHGINYKILKDFNPWLRQPNLLNPKGVSYEIKIPKGKYRTY